MNTLIPSIPANAVELILNRHGLRRATGLPTVSVLLGPVGAAIKACRLWATAHQRPIVTGSISDTPAIAALVARAVDSSQEAIALVCDFLAAHTQQSVSELRAALTGMTRHDLDLFFTAHDARLPSGESTRLARRILEAVVSGNDVCIVRWFVENTHDPLAAFNGLIGLIPPERLPVVVLTPPSSVGISEWFRNAGNAAVAVAMQIPSLPIAIAIPAEAWKRHLVTTPDSRVQAILREGVIELPVCDQTAVEQLLSHPEGNVPPIPPSLHVILASGVPESFAKTLASAITAPTQAATQEQDDEARSAAERFLFEFLELLPETAGRFELNADAGFRFGPRAAEVDLLARDWRIAIEIDGYYHFRDSDAYRRDREKDWELQRRGFLVLRFLADDIIPRLEEVRDRILAAIAHRTARIPS